MDAMAILIIILAISGFIIWLLRKVKKRRSHSR
jgi:flagellar biogenesis protein FliO